MTEASTIIYTKIDEAPALATHSLLPILQAYTKGSGIELDTWDISLTGRIIANFPDNLTAEQKIPDYLTMMGELCEAPEANIVKLRVSQGAPLRKDQVCDALKRALTHHQEGRLQKAEGLYEQILAIQPTHSDALQLFGLLLA